ncbi:zinc finger protein castor homolog 1-like isoform X3 [Mytilus edulis]
MALKTKPRSLDAICAKLKRINNDNDDNSPLPSTSTPYKPLVPQDLTTNGHKENNNNFDVLRSLSNGNEADENDDTNCRSTCESPVEFNENSQNNVSSSSRRKRKLAVPRNINQVRDRIDQIDDFDEKDELAQYTINNQNTTFPPENESDDVDSLENESDLSCDKNNISNDSGVAADTYVPPVTDKSIDIAAAMAAASALRHSKQIPPAPSPPFFNSRKHSRKPSNLKSSLMNAPLDLSMTKSFGSSDSFNSNNAADSENETAEDLSLMAEDLSKTADVANTAEDLSTKTAENNQKNAAVKSPNVDITVLKDYAESTMNELLQMYGFSGNSDGLTKQVPLANFNSNQILQTTMAQGKDIAKVLTAVSQQKNGLNNLSMADKKGIYANFVNAAQKLKQGDGIKPLNLNSTTSLPQEFTSVKPLTTISKSPLSASSVKHGLAEYSKYLKRFSNGTDCKVKYCKDLGYREHYHCMDCNFRVFVKKEEMVRHYKWHRKREESLQHGFMRYSPLDDCSQKFGSCTHNGRQTHYHCLQDCCDKVYISTSDVQMHANYHRKDSAIIQEGFQRFRATEDCGTPTCSFYGQRTTHFHCRRSGCHFTFKNKADMEKHKTYHQKDEVLAKDGFKKFMKYEHCGYHGCRYSKVSNHIHCIRQGVYGSCNYVLHSTAQLYSHKRKHERREFETAYQKYRDGSQDMMDPMGDNSMNNSTIYSEQDLSMDSMNDSFPPTPQVMQESMLLPVTIKREAPDSPSSGDSKRFKFDNLQDDSMSDQMSFKSESESFNDESSVIEENSILTEKSSSIVEEYGTKISGDQLNSSLTLPIPSVADDSDMKPVEKPPQFSVPLPQNKQPVYMTTSIAPQHLLPPMSGRTHDKREKDESWKSYLIRYTANDPCNSRCQYLYKDHYHCKVEGCLVLFKSKDGVREHARFHELQDRITPVAYTTYEQLEMCSDGCEFNLKEKHYHCIWTGCSHVVPHSGPTFGRLEHYRIHEYARASAGKSYRPSSCKNDDGSPKRRGRPPKYPKNDIPIIPKVELSHEEIEESTKGVEVDNYGIPQAINGFKIFKQGDICPDEFCIYRLQQHYHCARPRCHQATDRMDVLNLHAKDFHSFVNIMEGFEFFDRNVNCRRPHCHNNKANRHFHCVRPKCDYSFVRHSTMLQHDKKHQASEMGSVIQTSPIPDVPTSSVVSKAIAHSPTIKTSGTFYPLSGLSKGEGIQMSSVISVQPMVSSSYSGGQSSSTTFTPIAVPTFALSGVPLLSPGIGNSVSLQSAVKLQSPTVTSTITPLAAAPLTLLLQQKGSNMPPQVSWPLLRNTMHFLAQQNCGRPFCKLKKRDHYHCTECNQAFSDPARLRAHVSRHGIKLAKTEGIPHGLVNIAPKPENMNWNVTPIKTEPAPSLEDGENTEDAESSLNLNPNIFSTMIAKAQKAHNEVSDINENSNDEDEGRLVISELENESDDLDQNEAQDLSKWSGRKRSAPKNLDFVDTTVMVTKTKRTSVSPKRLKDDSIPNGYIRIKFKDDCGYAKCAYRSGITHFHCAREDCGYSFSDRSRLIQHTLRHERIDSLTGGEMQQYRMNQDCHRSSCEYEGKASHFHCLKCDYSCTDSSKVLTHRKNHAKMESINSQGFHKYGITEDCKFFACQYSGKQSHYHCLKSGCNFGVLGPAQMASHKLKHADESF